MGPGSCADPRRVSGRPHHDRPVAVDVVNKILLDSEHVFGEPVHLTSGRQKVFLRIPEIFIG
jgi:hypothetical protein